MLYAASSLGYVGGAVGAAFGAPGALLPMGNDLGAFAGRMQAVYYVRRGGRRLGGRVCKQSCLEAGQLVRLPCRLWPASSRTALRPVTGRASPTRRPPALPARLQTGQLSIPALPPNFRDTASQLSYIQMDFP